MVSPTKNVHYTSKLGLPGINQQRLTFVRRLICRDSVGICFLKLRETRME